MKQWHVWIGLAAVLALSVCMVACSGDLSRYEAAVAVAAEEKARADALVKAAGDAAVAAAAAAEVATARADELRVIADQQKTAEAEAAAQAATMEAAAKVLEAEVGAQVAARVAEEYAKVSHLLDAGIASAQKALEAAKAEGANAGTVVGSFLQAIAPAFGGPAGLAVAAVGGVVGAGGVLFGRKKNGEAKTAEELAAESTALAARVAAALVTVKEAFNAAKKDNTDLAKAMKDSKGVLLTHMNDDAFEVIESGTLAGGTKLPLN